MEILSAFLLSISANLDNLFLGMSFGIQNRRITLGCNILIGLFSAVAAFLCCGLASFLLGWGRPAHVLGGLLIIVLGVRAMREPEPDTPEKGAAQGRLSLRDAVLLGAALAANCIGLSFGAGLAGVPAIWAGLAVGAASVLTVGLGNALGLKAGLLVSGQRLNRLSGLTMLILGVVEIVL